MRSCEWPCLGCVVPSSNGVHCGGIGCPEDRWNLHLRGDSTGDPYRARDCLSFDGYRVVQIVCSQGCDRVEWVHEVYPCGIDEVVLDALAWCDDRDLSPGGDTTYHEVSWLTLELDASHAHFVPTVCGVWLRVILPQGLAPEARMDLSEPVVRDGWRFALL